MGSKVMDGTKRARLREKKFVFKIFLADRKIIKPDFNSQLVTFLSKINLFFIFFSDFAEITLQSQFFVKRYFEKMGGTKDC